MIANNSQKPSLASDAILSIGVIALMCGLYLIAANASPQTELIKEGWFFFGLGVVFLLAAYFHEKSILFRAIRWICCTISFPRKPYMVKVYSIIFFLVGFVQIMRWIYSEPD